VIIVVLLHATSGEIGTSYGQFASGRIVLATTFEYALTEEGEYPYYCMVHPNMVGTVSVT
jgi:plastocyanin